MRISSFDRVFSSVLDLPQLALGGLFGSGAYLVRVALEVAALGQRVANVLLGDG